MSHGLFLFFTGLNVHGKRWKKSFLPNEYTTIGCKKPRLEATKRAGGTAVCFVGC
jgi:hypothetical protein